MAHDGGTAPSVDAQEHLDANNMIYQVIQEHKQREHEKQMDVLRDAQSITDTMTRKRREAEENRSVVTASATYANNARYVHINSRLDPRIRLTRGMHPLNPDECDVYTSLEDAAENSTIAASMNHHITEGGEIDGFRFTCSGSDVASVLPVSRRMFFRTSMVECTSARPGGCESEDDDTTDSGGSVGEPSVVAPGDSASVCGSTATRGTARSRRMERDASELQAFVSRYNASTEERKASTIGLATAAMIRGGGGRHRDGSSIPMHVRRGAGGKDDAAILNLLLNQREVKKRLVRLVQTIYSESKGSEVSFSCMPDNSDIVDPYTSHPGRVDPMALFGSMHNRKAADSKEWAPEMPERVGIYHAYVRGFKKDTRVHKLFIVTSGGCTSMADAYFNVMVDIRNHMKVCDVVNSEETWYLRNACRRNNGRILLAVAREFNLEVPTVVDTYDSARGQIASSTTETMHYDVTPEKYGQYSMCSMSADTTRGSNGVLFSMHPSEGVWLFKGPVQTSSAMCTYGGPFGVDGCGTFPVSSSRVHDNYSWKSKAVPGSAVCAGTPCFVRSAPGPCVARVSPSSALRLGGGGGGVEQHTFVDEAYITSLQEDCSWSRDNGIIELIPIAVVEQAGGQ